MVLSVIIIDFIFNFNFFVIFDIVGFLEFVLINFFLICSVLYVIFFNDLFILIGLLFFRYFLIFFIIIGIV